MRLQNERIMLLRKDGPNSNLCGPRNCSNDIARRRNKISKLHQNSKENWICNQFQKFDRNTNSFFFSSSGRNKIKSFQCPKYLESFDAIHTYYENISDKLWSCEEEKSTEKKSFSFLKCLPHITILTRDETKKKGNIQSTSVFCERHNVFKKKLSLNLFWRLCTLENPFLLPFSLCSFLTWFVLFCFDFSI